MEQLVHQDRCDRHIYDKDHKDFCYDVKADLEFECVSNCLVEKINYKGVIKNFSVCGMCFNSDMCLPKGQRLILKCYLFVEDKPISMEGQVCWSNKRNLKHGQMYDTGVKLISVEGKGVEETIYHDAKYDVDWSEVLEVVLGHYRILVQSRKDY